MPSLADKIMAKIWSMSLQYLFIPSFRVNTQNQHGGISLKQMDAVLFCTWRV